MPMRDADCRPYALLGVFVIAAGMIVSATGYGDRPFTYSCLNHFASELGNHDKSRLASAYNLGLILGGSTLIVPAIGVRHISRPASVLLTAAVVGVVLLGFIPESTMLLFHVMIAAATFVLMETGVILIGARFASDPHLPRRWRMLGCTALTVVASILFLFSPKGRLIDAIHGNASARPDLWFLALMEWIFVASVGVWAIALSSSLHQNGESGDSDHDR